MDFELIESTGVPIKAWVKGVQIEDEAAQQLKNVASMPFVFSHIAAMQDVHWGMGTTIGSVIATKGAIIPAAVGADIGCGMIAQKTTLTASDLPDSLHDLRTQIEVRVPHGRTDNGGPMDRGAWGRDMPESTELNSLMDELHPIVEAHPRIEQAARRARNHAGTLGTGNHFIEICLDEDQAVWVMLHSGSRGIGNRIGQYFIELAKKDMERWFVNLPDKDLAYLPERTEHYKDYWKALNWAQRFAKLNRKLMMESALKALRKAVPKDFDLTEQVIDVHHNYVSKERHFGQTVMVTRKGATSAQEGEYGIIPGSMGTGSFIVRGKGNRESFCSCSHGAGRAMGRKMARKKFSLEDHIKATEGVECRKDLEVLDETPGAYKDINAVMKAQESLVDIVHRLKQVVCVKG